jgi:hypothetical protein
MIWFIVALAIFVFVGSMIDFSCNGWNVTKQFFTDSWWGLIAIVSGLLSLLMFYGSSKSYREVKINESFLPNPNRLNKTNQKGSKSMFQKDTEIVEFDLSQLTMNALTKKMAFQMTKPGPVFFKGWGNRRLLLDVERVEIIREYIEAVRATGDSLINLHADSVLSYEKMENLVKIKRNDLLHQLKESELKLDFLVKEHQSRVDKLKIDIAHLEALLYEKIAQIENLNALTQQTLSEIKNRSKEVDAEIKTKIETSEAELRIKERESQAKIELDNNKAKAEIHIMKLKAGDDSAISKKRAIALDMVIKEMNMDNITPTEVYLLIKLLDTHNTSDFIDFTNKFKIMEEELEKMKIQNEILKADAKERKAKANETEAQSKQNIKDLYNNR